jgi:hypothetical protein
MAFGDQRVKAVLESAVDNFVDRKAPPVFTWHSPLEAAF